MIGEFLLTALRLDFIILKRSISVDESLALLTELAFDLCVFYS